MFDLLKIVSWKTLTVYTFRPTFPIQNFDLNSSQILLNQSRNIFTPLTDSEQLNYIRA